MSDRKNKGKFLIHIFFGADSTGNIEYFISETVTDKKPLTIGIMPSYIHYQVSQTPLHGFSPGFLTFI